LGKVLIGTTVSKSFAFGTANKNSGGDKSPNALTTVVLPASSAPVDGPIGSGTLVGAYAKGTLSAGTNGDVTFDDGGDAETRTITVTPLMSGVVKATAAGGERSPGFLSVVLQQVDTAAGASGDARVYVGGDFYAPANITGSMSGTNLILTNTQATADGTPGKRLGADILNAGSAPINQSGWTLGALPTSMPGSRAGYTLNSTAVPAITPTATVSATLSPTGKLNGTYGATLTLQLQNDQTQGVTGVTAHDLPNALIPLTGTVSDKPAVQNGFYTLDGGTLAAPATTLTGTFSQSGGTATIASGSTATASLLGGGTVIVSGGTLTIGSGSTTQADVVGPLIATGTGKIILADRHLVTQGSPRSFLQSGALTSSQATADTTGTIGVGYATGAQALGLSGASTAAWFGATVGATTELVSTTYFGDTNLDGKVDRDDYARIDRGRAKGLTTWADGDFNYDGSVTSADYLLADKAFAFQGAPLDATFLASREAEFGSAYVSSLLASVPEPTSLGLVGVAAAGLIGRRRRQGAAAK
jgi:hypothetical protein